MFRADPEALMMDGISIVKKDPHTQIHVLCDLRAISISLYSETVKGNGIKIRFKKDPLCRLSRLFLKGQHNNASPTFTFCDLFLDLARSTKHFGQRQCHFLRTYITIYESFH